MTEFEDEKTLIWYGRSNWHNGQILALKKLRSTVFEFFISILNY